MSDTVNNRFRLLKPGVIQVPDPVQPLDIAQLAIKEAKVKDVNALSQYLSPVAQQFIALLIATNERDAKPVGNQLTMTNVAQCSL